MFVDLSSVVKIEITFLQTLHSYSNSDLDLAILTFNPKLF